MRWALVAAAAVLVLAMGCGLAAAEDGEALFAEALRKERADGDLKGAVEIYRRIAKESAADRPLAARALVQLGKAQEKLGQAEARAAYEKVLADYGDQADAVAQARDRLRRLAVDAQPSTGFAVRKIGELSDLYGSPSPDGRYISFVNWTKGNLAVFETATGKTRDLTDEGVWSDASQFADNSIWSPDSRQIAYCWFSGPSGPERQNDLRLIGPEGGKSKVLISKRGERAPWPIAYHPDGRSILAAIGQTGRPDDPTQIVWVDSATGAITPVRRFDRRPRELQLSPDARHAVYMVREMNADPRDLRIWDLKTGADEPLVQHPSDDGLPFWSPDGKHVVFFSDRGRAGLWAIAVEGGKASGAPRLLVEGRYTLTGFASDGTLYCSGQRTAQNVYVANLDVENGVLGQATLVPTRHEGMVMNPFWSPDGSKLAFIARRDANSTLIVRDMASGVERDLAQFESPQLYDDPIWTPDGKSILTATGLRERAIHRFGVADGKSEKVATLEVKPWEGLYKALTPDGNLLLARKREGTAWDLIMRDLKSGHERTIRKSERELYRMALSPDGNQLAHFEANEQWQTALVITNIADGSVRTTWEHEQKLFFPRAYRPAWMPDGKRLIVQSANADQTEFQFHVVDAGSGQHKPIGPPAREIVRWHPSLRPDGKQIAFAAKRSVLEIWAMTNVLSGAQAEK